MQVFAHWYSKDQVWDTHHTSLPGSASPHTVLSHRAVPLWRRLTLYFQMLQCPTLWRLTLCSHRCLTPNAASGAAYTTEVGLLQGVYIYITEFAPSGAIRTHITAAAAHARRVKIIKSWYTRKGERQGEGEARGRQRTKR